MRPRFYVFVNGILNLWNTNTAFTDNAVRYVMTHTRHRADKFEAPITVLSASWKQRERVAAFRKWLAPYCREHDLYLVGHSWGARIIVDYLHDRPIYVKAVYLIAAACDADCDKNGLNTAASLGMVDRVHITKSDRDVALKLARSLGWIAGYGSLGLTGPTNVKLTLADRMVIWRRNIGHRAWWDSERFEQTMQIILGAK